MVAARALVAGLLAVGMTGPALACIGPAPTIQLSGEAEAAFRARSQAFSQAERDEDRRAAQTRLYDTASRVSLARVLTSERLPGVLSGGISQGSRVEVQPMAYFKGSASKPGRVVLQDAGMTTCGPYGGGTATSAAPGSYVLLFEDVSPEGPTGHFGLLLTELREPRVLDRFSEVVQKARAQGAQR